MNELVRRNLYLVHMDEDELYHHGILGMHWPAENRNALIRIR